MDIRQLHYFLVLCEEMNYTRAAQRLFLSRQALRQSITALEAELCGPLFVSAHHKLSLTERGLSLQRHAAPVVEQFQQMQAALHAEIQSAQPVRIGISVSLVPDYLPGSGDPAGQVPPAVPPHRDAVPPAGQRCRGRRSRAGRAGRGAGHGPGLRGAGAGPHHAAGRPCLPAGAARPPLLGKGAGAAGSAAGGSGCCCQVCGRTCLRPCGTPAPRRVLRPTPRSAPASIRPIIWCRSSCAPV